MSIETDLLKLTNRVERWCHAEWDKDVQPLELIVNEILPSLRAILKAVPAAPAPAEAPKPCAGCGKLTDHASGICGWCYAAAAFSPSKADKLAAPPERAQPKHWLNPFHDCGVCRTLTHCAHHRRCLAECTPSDLVSGETAAPDYTPVEQACKGCMGPCGQCEAIAAERTAAPEAAQEIATYLGRQMAFSRRTFGEGRRTLGVTAHIAKELDEIRQKPDDLSEWVDVIILAMDGYWRHGGTPDTLMRDLQAKQDKNIARKWPTPTSEDVPVEHDRTSEAESHD